MPETETEIEEVKIRRKKRKPTGRKKLPGSLPRKRVILKPTEDDKRCRCCEQEMVTIGLETSEQLDYIPSSLRILETIRPKLACTRCRDRVVTLPPPAQAIPKCLATPSLLAHVVTSKFADHLPLNRQAGILARHGAEVSRSTLCGWVGRVADAVVPVYDMFKELVLSGVQIRADDTSIRVLDKKLRQTRKGHLWDYLGDDNRLVVFDFTPDWRAEWPVRFLDGFEGKLQADAYKGWSVVAELNPRIELVGCMAHARRKWDQAKTTDIGRATRGLLYFRALYKLEKLIAGLTPEERAAARQERAGPILDELYTWALAQRPFVLPQSPVYSAITYLDNQWELLRRYLYDGTLEIDNNDVERILRSVAVGRANWLFAGSESGGRRAAILYSLIMSCKLNGLDPYAWLVDVLTRLPGLEREDLHELLPYRWKPVTDIARERSVDVIEELVEVSLAS